MLKIKKKRFIGPNLVVDKSEDGLLYRLRHCETGHQNKRMIHYNRLKPYNENMELFYTRNKIAPQSRTQSQTQPQTQSQTDSSQSDWLNIKKSLSRKKIKGKDTWLIHWMDGSTSREPTENIKDYAKTMYYLAQGQRKRRRSRRQM